MLEGDFGVVFLNGIFFQIYFGQKDITKIVRPFLGATDMNGLLLFIFPLFYTLMHSLVHFGILGLGLSQDLETGTGAQKFLGVQIFRGNTLYSDFNHEHI